VIALGLAALLVIGAAVLLAVVLRDNDEPAFAADLARLRSIDDLYTAPQIRQQAGYSLEATAFSRAALRRLGQDVPPLAPAARARLAAGPGAPAALEALARSLLAREGGGDGAAGRAPAVAEAGTPAGAPAVAGAPTRARLRALWRRALTGRDDAAALDALADVAEATAPGAAVGGRAPAAGGARLAALLRRTAGDVRPAVARNRARLVRVLHLRPDAAIRRAARRQALIATTTGDRVTEAAGILEAAAAAGRRPARAAIAALVDAASQADDPETIWVALGALRAVGRSPSALRGRALTLRRGLGSVGAVREIAIFQTIPKAVWLAAHLRLAAGADALPEGDTVALSKVMVRRDSLTADVDDRALLFASARLAGLSYDNAALSRAPVPAAIVASTEQAIAWAQRAQVSSDLGSRPVSVTLTPWALDEDVDVAALGLVLAVTQSLGTKAVLPPGTVKAFRKVATTVTFRSSRWATWAAAGLAASGFDDDADAVLARVHVGCPGFAHLVADTDGTCDLESTWFALRLAKEGIPAAERLRARILGASA
jgi:hypothetical protein